MNVLNELRRRFDAALNGLAENRDEFVDMIRRSQEPKFGDYQANCAMPLGKQLGKNPREVAAEIVRRLDIADLCEPAEIAGPGFINLKLKQSWLIEQLGAAVSDTRLTVKPAKQPRTFVVDFSAPNVAKPMHVGHIRSTVIGDAIVRTLRFLGHHVVGDNHLGDWGTQFGMIIYGYKHFLDRAAYQRGPVDELARLYKLVNQLVEYHANRVKPAAIERSIAEQESALASLPAVSPTAPKNEQKAQQKERKQRETKLAESRAELQALRSKLMMVEGNPQLAELASRHAYIGEAVLAETAKLHAGDEENRRLWNEFLPACLEALNVVYRRLGVQFDVTLGESFYHDKLAGVVEELLAKGIARRTEGAVGVFLEGQQIPLLIQKQDGAFLYATSDLATIAYRMQQWHPDAILYVVDHRQSLHFEQLFAAARLWGFVNVRLAHLSFGTVLGDDGRPFKTRSGDTVNLSGLLDEAVRKALEVVSTNDDAKPNGPELAAQERQRIAEIVGIGALKYADLSQNRTSDYVFSYEKMLAMEGNTATYMQYAYARVRNIFVKGGIDVPQLRNANPPILLDTPEERAVALELLRFGEALELAMGDYRPNQLTSYLFELATAFSTFYNQHQVLKAESEPLCNSRLLLCDLTARTIKQGLHLLGIEVVEKM